jgi:hypothetical protein
MLAADSAVVEAAVPKPAPPKTWKVVLFGKFMLMFGQTSGRKPSPNKWLRSPFDFFILKRGDLIAPRRRVTRVWKINLRTRWSAF